MMLRSLTWLQFNEWREYYQMDYFGEGTREMRVSKLLALIAEVNRDPKVKSGPFREKDFFIYPELLPKPNWEDKWAGFKDYTLKHNAVVKAKK